MFRIAFLALVSVVALFPGAALAQAGYVHAMSGVGVIQSVMGAVRPVKAGDTFESGAIFDTGESGRVVLKFADGLVVVIGPNSTLRVGRCRYDSKNVKGSALAIGLVNGTMRVVTGAIGADNCQAMRVTAGGSMVTITKGGGADFTLVIDTRSHEVGVAAVTMGEIAVRTPYGVIAKIETGQFGSWQPGRAPPLPMPLAAMPAVVHSSVVGLWALALPARSPTAVDSAARDASSAVVEAADAAGAAIAALFDRKLSDLPVPAAGLEPVAPAPTIPPAPAIPPAFRSGPISPISTPGGGGRCLGSPC